MTRKILKNVGYVIIILFALLAIVFIGIALWGSYFSLKADFNLNKIAKENSNVKIENKDRYISIVPQNLSSKIGLIYYPGARVEPEAYTYKLSGIAEKTGISIYITKPYLNFAIFGISDADLIRNNEKSITSWYVGGHSLGGSMACQYLSNINDGSVAGLILFGSYCGTDISKSGIRVLSIVGSVDGLTTQSKITQYKHDIPDSSTFITIEGMNHAQNGNYGKQDGDKDSYTSDLEVIDKMADAIKDFVER